MNRIAMIFMFILMAVVIGGFLFWIVTVSENEKKQRIANVSKGFKLTRGIILDIKSYKGHSIKLRYTVKDSVYESQGGWDVNPRKLRVGDSINLKYAIADPQYIIIELESVH